MDSVPWYKSFWTGEYGNLYTSFRSPESMSQDAADLIQLLALPQGSSVLDLCCGSGDISNFLAAHGFKVSGQDLNSSFLQLAQERAQQHGHTIDWIERDMRDIPFEQAFDAVVNVFSSFGYLEDEEEDLLVLRQVYKALKPGGVLVLELTPLEVLIRRFVRSHVQRVDDIMILHECSFDFSRSRHNADTLILYPDGRRAGYKQSMRVYTLRELMLMFKAVGLSVLSYYGGLDQSPFTLGSSDLVIVGKRADSN